MLLYIKTKKFQPGGMLGYNNQLADPTNPFATPYYGGMSKDPFGGSKTGLDSALPNNNLSKNTPSTAFSNNQKSLLYKPSNISDPFKVSTPGFSSNPTSFSQQVSLPNTLGEVPKKPVDTGLDSAQSGKYAGAVAAGTGLVAGAIAADTYSGPEDPTKYTRKDQKNDMKKATAKGISTGASVGGAVGAALGPAAAGTVASTLGLGAGAGAASLAAGVAVPVIGAVVVGLGFAIASMFGRKKKKRAAARARERQIASLNAQQRAERKAELQTGADTSVNAPAPTAYGASQPSTYEVARKGGVLYSKKKVLATPMLKKGGPIKEYENIIPNGVLHEEENSLGDKGMPVVKCVSNVCTKKYEIEKEELIFTLDTTKKVEQLAKSKNHKALGDFVKEQLLDNTHSFSDKFSELNNR